MMMMERARASDNREDDTMFLRFLAGILRWRGVGLIVATSLVTTLGLAWKFTPRLEAIEKHAAKVDMRLDLLAAQRDSDAVTNRLTHKKICFDLTKADQEYLDANCPPNIYKGALRSLP